jgi:hypothetical protein
MVNVEKRHLSEKSDDPVNYRYSSKQEYNLIFNI